MSEKKKKRTLWLLGVLLVVLFAVIMVLCIKYKQRQNKLIAYYNNRMAVLSEELNKDIPSK